MFLKILMLFSSIILFINASDPAKLDCNKYVRKTQFNVPIWELAPGVTAEAAAVGNLRIDSKDKKWSDFLQVNLENNCYRIPQLQNKKD